jgi:hypothetical protein
MTPALDMRPVRFGVLFAVLTLLFGFGLGGAFGAAEDSLKGHLKAKAEAVKDTIYEGDEAKLGKVTGKSWTYLKRAHLHANGLGTTALALSLLTSMFLVRLDERFKLGVTTALGVGSLGYSVYWLLAGLSAPALGSTHDAKEGLGWLAIPSAGLLMLGLIAVLGAFVHQAFVTPESAPAAEPPAAA